MNQTIKQQWIAALTSGEYQQGDGTLRNQHDEFCCLGVLCDLYAKTHPEAKWLKTATDRYRFHGDDRDGGCGGMPPEVVYQWAGIDLSFFSDGYETMGDLANMNDNGTSFEEIAIHIDNVL